MKTLFIPVYHGMCTRNLFLTEMLPTILKQPDLRAVCFIPPLKKDFFAKEYGHFKNVIFESVDRKHKKNKLEFIFDFITKSFLNTQAKKSLQLIEYSSDPCLISSFTKYLAVIPSGAKSLPQSIFTSLV